MQKNEIGCIIVTYNAEIWIEKCINSVLNSTVVPDLVIIDNNSQDKTVGLIKSKFQLVNLQVLENNIGFGKANNIAIKQLYEQGCNFFLLLNQDAWIEKDTIEILISTLNKNSDFGIISPLQFYNQNSLDRKFRKYLGKTSNDEELKDVRFVNAAIWMMSRECIQKVGLFANIFHHYGEDQNYSHRCSYHKLKVGIDLTAIGYHERNQKSPKYQSLNKLLKNDEAFILSFLLNIKHGLIRQILFLNYKSIVDLIKFLYTLQFKKIIPIIFRYKVILNLFTIIKERNIMKKNNAYLVLK